MYSNSQPSKIEQRVMRRVGVMRFARPILSGEALAFVVAIAALYGLGREVWVARVFQNAPSLADFSAASHFWLAAFVNTRSIVQVLIVAMFAAVVYLFIEFTRAFAATPQFA